MGAFNRNTESWAFDIFREKSGLTINEIQRITDPGWKCPDIECVIEGRGKGYFELKAATSQNLEEANSFSLKNPNNNKFVACDNGIISTLEKLKHPSEYKNPRNNALDAPLDLLIHESRIGSLLPWDVIYPSIVTFFYRELRGFNEIWLSVESKCWLVESQKSFDESMEVVDAHESCRVEGTLPKGFMCKPVWNSNNWWPQDKTQFCLSLQRDGDPSLSIPVQTGYGLLKNTNLDINLREDVKYALAAIHRHKIITHD